MPVVELTSREAIAAFLSRDPVAHAYELGDLDDFHWPHTTWYALERGDGVEEILLLYDEPSPPVLVAAPEGPAMRDLLEGLRDRLPGSVYGHLDPAMLDVLRPRYDARSHGLHLRMGLSRRDLLERHDTGHCVRLSPADLADVEELYAAAYPGTWFAPRMLEAGPYVGVREDGRLVAVGGVHVHSPRFGVAALGNVATLPGHRGRGLATALCARLCREILAEGVSTIALNVRSDNAPAIAAYRKLGFETAREFEEVLLTERPERR